MSGQAGVAVDWNGPQVSDKLRDGAAAGLLVAMEFLLTEANVGVPLDEGTLERSGVAQADRSTLRGIVSYDTPYAVRQHEDLTARHAPGRHAKWLELALLRNKQTLPRLVQRQMRLATGG